MMLLHEKIFELNKLNITVSLVFEPHDPHTVRIEFKDNNSPQESTSDKNTVTLIGLKYFEENDLIEYIESYTKMFTEYRSTQN